MKKLFPYLLLNIIVSAVTTLAVLMAWDALHVREQRPVEPSSVQPTAAVVVLQPTPLPVDAVVIRVESVVGVGDVQNELVRLVREGSGDLPLEGWTLQDENGNKYTFPKVDFITGAIEVHTGSGPDTAVELHWGQTASVWQPGETVKVFDPQGVLRASYQIP
jgi:hypothetical protein